MNIFLGCRNTRRELSQVQERTSRFLVSSSFSSPGLLIFASSSANDVHIFEEVGVLHHAEVVR